MVKDHAKYASTDGWGFGRWKTTDLVPYGKTKFFANECVSCHAPMAANDHVFTMPIRDQPASDEAFNGLAALPGGPAGAAVCLARDHDVVGPDEGTMSHALRERCGDDPCADRGAIALADRRAGGAGDVEAAGGQALVRRADSRRAGFGGGGDGDAACHAGCASQFRLRVVQRRAPGQANRGRCDDRATAFAIMGIRAAVLP